MYEMKSETQNDLLKAMSFCLKNFNLINSKIGLVHRVSKKARWTRFWGTFGFWISLALAVFGILLSVK